MTIAQLPLAARPHHNRQLFSDHYLDAVLPTRAEWVALAGEAAPAMARIAALFAAFAPSDNETQTERELVRPVLAVGFPLFRADTNVPIHEVFFTDSAGYARSPEAPPRTPPHLREVQLPSHHSASRGRRSEA